jgi:outer membrane biosynthesis protein TonB
VLAAMVVLAGGVLAGVAVAGLSAGRAPQHAQTGPKPDPPPKAPPPPPPAAPQPPPPPAAVAPPPPAVVAPPPPPQVLQTRRYVFHRRVHRRVHRHATVRKASRSRVTDRTVRKTKVQSRPVLAAASPVSAGSGGSSPALLIAAFGLAVALLVVGVSCLPAWALPFALSLRLDRNRPTILVVGLAVAVACVLVGLLTSVVGG